VKSLSDKGVTGNFSGYFTFLPVGRLAHTDTLGKGKRITKNKIKFIAQSAL
jgi:hypothetical protein